MTIQLNDPSLNLTGLEVVGENNFDGNIRVSRVPLGPCQSSRHRWLEFFTYRLSESVYLRTLTRSITREILARLLHLGTGIARTRQFNQFGEVLPRFLTVAGLCRRLPRAVQAAITVRLALLRGFVFS